MTSTYSEKPLQTPTILFPPVPSHNCTELIRISDWNEFTTADAAAAWVDPRRKGRDYDQQWRASELQTTTTSFARRGGFSNDPWAVQHAPSGDFG